MFPDNFQWILLVLPFWAIHTCVTFLDGLEKVIPTQRGDHIFKVIFREVNCCDAELLKHIGVCRQISFELALRLGAVSFTNRVCAF